MFSALKERLSRNGKRLSEAIKGEAVLDENRLDELLFDLELALIESDVALEVVDAVKADVKAALLGRSFGRGADLSAIVKQALRDSVKKVFVDGDLLEIIREGKRPFVIVFVGVNGTGKTTTIAKVARLLEREGFSTVIAAADTYRAGAIEQIEKHASNLGVRLIKQGRGADSAAVAFDAIEHARARGLDVVLIDTAGRMDTNVNLMDELKKVVRVSRPDLVLFVGDALSGNAVVEQVRTFHQYTPIDGAIITKADADAKGGSAISIAATLKRPVFFLGTGQGYDDLQRFNGSWFVDQILPL
ncbi:MAG: signal recognition particle-docking protein FtsY [Methanobacteriota archaeon]|nr:MAG: signal recognition particle-docking protein FtsY [Euryarchaeota archaeon]